MDNVLVIKVLLKAVDQMSQVINKGANYATKKLTSLHESANKLADNSFKAGQQLVASGVAMGAPLVAITKQAMDFEEAMADVAKVADFEKGGIQLQDLAESAKQLGPHLGKSAAEAAGLMANLAAGGIPTDKLAEVAKSAGEIGVAFDMSATDAGDRFVKLMNSMRLSIGETQDAANAMNLLSDKDASKAREILDFMTQGGASAAQSLHMSAAEMSAIGSAFLSIGKSADVSGTTVKRMQKTIVDDKVISAIYKQAGGGMEGLMAVMEKGAGLKGDARDQYFQRFGEYGNEVKELAFNMEKVHKNVELVANSSNYANSVSNEFNKRMDTTAGRLARVKAQAEVVGLEMGETLLPILKDILDQVLPLIKRFGEWVKQNPELVKGILKAVAGLAALKLATGYLSFAAGGIFRLFSMGTGTIKNTSKAIGWLTDKKKGLGHWIFVMRYRWLQLSQFMTGRFIPAANRIGAVIGSSIGKVFMGVGRVFSVVGRIVGVVSRIFSGVFVRAIGGAIKIFSLLGNVMRANPIGAAITIIGLLLTYLITNVQSVKDAFMYVINKIVGFFQPLIDIVNLVIKGAKLLFGFFSGDSGPQVDATAMGEKTVDTYAQGMENKFPDAQKTMGKGLGGIRDQLPSSPAKKGPLKDLHKIKIVQTIGESIKKTHASTLEAPLQSVLARATNMAGKGIGLDRVAARDGFGGGITANFTINLNGGSKNDATQVALECKRVFQQLMKEYTNQQARVSFA